VKTDFEGLIARRLRELRIDRGFTLDGFEAHTNGKIKAVVLGSYERGTRAISLARLVELADLFEVPIQYFLETHQHEQSHLQRWIFDLRVLRRIENEIPELEALKKYLNYIALMRTDWRGEVLTIRKVDSDILSIILGNDGFIEDLKTSKTLLS
jgi:transcriptional regulator with XRE-family HTH domain